MDKVFKYELFNKMIRDFAVNEVKPLAHEVDEQERFPYETVEKMAKLGLMGIIVPKEYGGMGGDYKMYIKACQGLRHDGRYTFRAHLAVHCSDYGVRQRRTKEKISA